MVSSLQLPDRSILKFVKKDLDRKMVFLGGPRQVGKTTLAQSLLTDLQEGYFNYDSPFDRKRIVDHDFSPRQKLIVLDEIHKQRGWRNTVKGLYDTKKQTHQFLITGSARLDHFRKGGDSLLGRYYSYRLHPYSLRELGISRKNTQKLLKFGGFPEPLSSQDESVLYRWHLARLSKLVRVDLRDLENIKNLDQVELLGQALLSRVGSPLSINNLAKDLQVDFKTVQRWIEILDTLYYSFRIPPFGAPKIKAVKKEQKLYLWDWSQIEDPGFRFENLVASQLLKFCHFIEDTQGHPMELRYLRTTEKREVDFVVLKNRKPLFAVECKLSDTQASEHLYYFKQRTDIPKFYQVHLGAHDSERMPAEGIHVLPFERLVEIEELP